MARRLETLTNVAIVTVSLLASVTLVKNLLSHRPQGAASPHVAVGNQVTVPGLDWRAAGSTLVLALRPDCHFCSDSAPFYRRLAAAVSDRPIQLTALFPESVETGADYLQSLGVEVTNVRRGSFESLRIPGTPTLMLVDAEGVVRNVWLGKLPVDTEREVLDAVLAAAPCCVPAAALGGSNEQASVAGEAPWQGR